MILIQNYYIDKNEARQLEIDKCLEYNVANPHITKIVLLIETEARPTIESKKIEVVRVPNRPTFTELFETGNTFSSVNDVIIISNSDIYFDKTIALANEIGENECYALSRWNMVNGGLVPFHHSDSQDTWIMRNPIKEVKVDFTLGVPGCCSAESVIKYRRIGETSCFGETTLESFFYEFGCNSVDDFYIRSWNIEMGYHEWNKVKLVIGSGVKEVWRLGVENDMFIDATRDHRILSNGEFVPLEDLDLLQNVMTIHGESKVDLTRSMGETMTYDITMEAPLSNFECNGIFVHNCDNSISHHLERAGYNVINPCKKIITIHLHDGNEHNYTAQDRVPPPYLRVLPI